MTIKMGADTVQDIDGMLTTTASVPYAINIFQLVAKSQVEILPTDMILGLGYAGHAAVALSPMMTVGEYINTWSSDVMYTENDAFILDLTGLYVDCVNMMGNLTFIAYLARQNEDGSIQIIDIDLTYKCQLGEHNEINVGPNDVSLNDDGTTTFNMDVFSFPIGDYVIECDNEIPDDYYLIAVGYNTEYTDQPNALFAEMIQDTIDAGILNRNNLNKIFLNSAVIEMFIANFDINKVAFFISNEDRSIILSTRCSFDSINQEMLAPYYFEMEGEHEVEFEYVYKFMPELSFPRTNSYFENSCIIELNDNFYDYYEPGRWISSPALEKINLSNNVPENMVESYVLNLKLFSNLKEININTDKYITINNCVINKTNWSLAGYCGTDIVVPGLVKSIGTIFSNNSKLKTVVLPNGITSISNNAFTSCSSLTSVNIPNSVTSIGVAAFENCSSLTSVNIPDSVTSIGSDAFYNCSNLTSVNISSLESWFNINFKSSGSNPLRYAKNLYLNNELITDLVIPDSVADIKNYAFYGCSSLTSVTIPKKLNIINGEFVFDGCSNMKNVIINTSLSDFMSNTFFALLSSPLRYAENIYKDGEIILSLSESLIVPDSVTSIAPNLFYGNKTIRQVTIPDSVTSIGERAFSNSVVKSITMGNGVTSIAKQTFYNSSLESITMGNGVTSIGEQAFMQCSRLNSITIPDSVTDMTSKYIFYGCNNLSEIICNCDKDPEIGFDTFKNIKSNGVMKFPNGAVINQWNSTQAYCLGYYNWSIEYI